MDSWDKLNDEIIHCWKCPRLVRWREEVARVKKKAYRDWEYWGKPVPGFGDHHAKVFVIGLAPGAHGSNRTGRMFTGDSAGNFLYRALFKAGFANQPTSSTRNDGLTLDNIFISALCRCVPPGNKPARDEILNCRPYLLREIALIKDIRAFVALGSQAWSNLAIIYRDIHNQEMKKKFGHGVTIEMESNPSVIASYHPSQQNTQTRKLTEAMFDSIWESARNMIAG